MIFLFFYFPNPLFFLKKDGISKSVCDWVFSFDVGIELIRFNNNLGAYPLITLETSDIEANLESNLQKKKIHGIGYTIEYEYIKQQKENSDVRLNKIISGKFKLFNEFLLSAWIE